MNFADFVSWAEHEMGDWKPFWTLGEIKRHFEKKPLKDKFFFAKYDPLSRVIFQTIYDPGTVKPNKLRIDQVKMIFDRFVEASPSDKMTSSHYQIHKWEEAPDKIATPAVAAIIWHWHDRTGGGINKQLDPSGSHRLTL